MGGTVAQEAALILNRPPIRITFMLMIPKIWLQLAPEKVRTIVGTTGIYFEI